VNEAVPNEAPQDTTLVVRVIGSGFDDGTTVKFLLAGQSAPKMVVNSSIFVNDKNLDVNVTIAIDADVASYDIEATTLRGKKGIGSEKFSVKLKGGPPQDSVVSTTFRDAAGDGVVSDGGGAYQAVILELGNLRLDARVAIPRQLCFDFAGQSGAPTIDCDDGYLTTSRAGVAGGFLGMPAGSSMTTAVQVTWVIDGYNWFLRFGMDCSMDDDAGNRAVVTHADATTWTLEGSTATLCKMPVKGRPRAELVGVYGMPFKLTIVK